MKYFNILVSKRIRRITRYYNMEKHRFARETDKFKHGQFWIRARGYICAHRVYASR